MKFPEVIKVKLKGPRAFLRSLAKDPLDLTLNVDHAISTKRNVYTFNLGPGSFNLPLGVEIAEVKPEKVTVEIDKKVRKKVRVRARMVGEVDQDHKVFRQEIHPKRIEIEGARKNIDKIKFVWTKPIEVNKFLGEGEDRVQLEYPFPHIRKSSVDELIFSYRIIPTKANLTLDNVKIQFLTSFKIQDSTHRFATLSVYSRDKEEVDLREGRFASCCPDSCRRDRLARSTP